MAAKAATAAETPETNEEGQDGPLLDSLNAAVKKLVARGKERGFITYDELNSALPSDDVSSEQIEDTMAMLNDLGINIVENEEEETAAVTSTGSGDEEDSVAGNVSDEEAGRTDDPVRLYLREMGSVELLSREGEIAIAKRIEAGREMMISGICESPLTIQAILGWHDALNEGKMLLRDIIDLEATYGGGPSSEAEMLGEGESAEIEETEEEKPEGEDGESEFDVDSDEENLSLSMLEEKLKPQVMETFDKIASTYARLVPPPDPTPCRDPERRNPFAPIEQEVRSSQGRACRPRSHGSPEQSSA